MAEALQTILITGGTVGLGYEAALQIAKEQPSTRIILASRTNPNSADETINELTGHKNVVFQKIDLGSLANVRSFANSLIAQGNTPIKALVLNAGVQIVSGVKYTTDGYEMTFGINHVGHALLFHLLYPHMTADARVVVTASGTHDPAQKTGVPDAAYNTAEELAHPTEKTLKHHGRQRYATSKLVNIMWTYSLARRLSDRSGVTVTAFDPGLMPGTGLVRDAGAVINFAFTRILPYLIPLLRRFVLANTHTPHESGFALARLAVGADVEGVSGKYYEGLKPIGSSPLSKDLSKQEDLWAWTVKAISRDPDEQRLFGFEV